MPLFSLFLSKSDDDETDRRRRWPLPTTRVLLSGTWETSVVHNYRNFLRHCGVAFARSKLDASVVKNTLGEAAKTVDACEIHSISHTENTLADVLVSENGVSLTNITEIGKRRVIVFPDGATSTVQSRWDDDVWVEVDELNLLETRGWLE